MMDQENIIEALGKEPLTHLMAGHRELFHSNLLAWFFEKLPGPADQVFKRLASSAPKTCLPRLVSREKRNLDLWFQWPEYQPLVLENKVFSLPDEEQLTKYTEKALGKPPTPALWLLSLSDPGWSEQRKVIASAEWRWLSFRTLADDIRTSLPDGDTSYPVETMRHYAEIVKLLSELVETLVVKKPSDTVMFPKRVSSRLRDNRLGSMVKLRANSVAQYVGRKLRSAGVGNCRVKADLAHGMPLIDWFSPMSGAPGACTGWQFQDGQFRLAMIAAEDLQGEALKNERSAFAQKHGYLFDFSRLDACLGTMGAPVEPASPDFRHFSPGFIYRYKRVPSLTVGQLADAAVAIAGDQLSK